FTVTASDAGAGFHLHGIVGLLNLLTLGFLGLGGHTSTVTVPVNVTAWKRSNTGPAATVTVGSPNATTGVVVGRVVATDTDGTTLTYSAPSSTGKGTVAVATNGAFTYTPTASARHAAASDSATSADLADSFDITDTDAQGGTTLVSVTVAIGPKNSAPVAGTPTVGTPDPSTGVVNGTVTATDADNDPLTFSTPGSTTRGAVIIDSGTGEFTYTPNTLGVAASTDTFTVTITDGHGGSTPVAVSVPIPASVVTGSLVTYVFNYTEGARYWTAAAKQALQFAADEIASYIVVSAPVTLTFEVTASNAPDSDNLASAGSDLEDSGSGYFSTVVQGKLLGGVDGNGSGYDGSIDANFGQPWAFGDTVAGDEYDFISTMMHEMMHAYGFLSYIDEAGYNTSREWTVFDSFVADENGTPAINTLYRFKAAFNPNLTGGNGGLYFVGDNAVAAYGGPVPIYTPDPWESGSSGSHLDDDTFTGSNAQLMNALADSGRGVRVLSAVEQGILQDLGYTLSPASMIFIGFFIRRRKVKT
ncbi:MAG: Ig-like domain-containing protein, partial [Mycobacterium sp.]